MKRLILGWIFVVIPVVIVDNYVLHLSTHQGNIIALTVGAGIGLYQSVLRER